MKNLITRKDKKKIRYIILCHTGNILYKKEKISKLDWFFLKKKYEVWLYVFSKDDIFSANSIKKVNNKSNPNF